MAKGFGLPSKFIASNLKKNAVIYALFLLGTIISLYFAYELATSLYSKNNALKTFIFFLVYCLILYGVVVAFKFAFNTDTFLRGGIGENIISEELFKLPDTYSIFRGVHVNNSKEDIDFVVLGPKGIFTVEVKSHSGRITYNGRELLKNDNPIYEKDILKQGRHEAGSLREYLAHYGLEGYIKPVIVFSNSWTKVNFGMSPVDGVVYVVGKNWLTKLIYSFPDTHNTSAHPIIEQILMNLVEK